MHPIELNVLGIYTGKDPEFSPTEKSFTQKFDMLTLGILELEHIGTQLVPKSLCISTDSPVLSGDTVYTRRKNFFSDCF